jgi:(p)ppGpp synthase/HD superfamily hydrolase
MKNLEDVFQQPTKYNLQLNPNKCTLGVEADKFLGYMLTNRGVEINPDKCRDVLELSSPSSVKEVQ